MSVPDKKGMTMITEKFVTYCYDPGEEKLFVARVLEDLQPGDMAVVPSFSRFQMCLVRVVESGKEPTAERNTARQFRGEIPWCYGVFDRSKFDAAMEHSAKVLENLSK